LYIYSFNNGKWENIKVNAPDFGTISIHGVDEFSDQYFFSFTNFLTPPTLFLANARDNSFAPFQSLPPYFDATRYKVVQYKAKSTDGTLIPYYVVSSNTMEYNGKNPTLLNAYGVLGSQNFLTI
jgi:prolyl oligopeptidase